MLPPNHDNQSKQLQLDTEWAKQACKQLLAGCTLNIKLVQSGFWPTLLCDIVEEHDLEKYTTFLEGLGLSYLQASKVDRGH